MFTLVETPRGGVLAQGNIEKCGGVLAQSNIEKRGGVLAQDGIEGRGSALVQNDIGECSNVFIEKISHPHHRPQWQPGSIGSIVQQFKQACTKRIHAMELGDFSWQSRFHDRIIRDEHALANARMYIQENPKKWMVQHMDNH